MKFVATKQCLALLFALCIIFALAEEAPMPFGGAGSEREQALWLEGKSRHREWQNSAETQRFGPCWQHAFDQLLQSCSKLSEDSQTRLALEFANCQLQKSGFKTFPCKSDESILSCTKNMNDRAFLAYNQFYTHIDSVCFYLESSAWQRKTHSTINKLQTVSVDVVDRLSDSVSFQEEVFKTQGDALEQIKQESTGVKTMIGDAGKELKEIEGLMGKQANQLSEQAEQLTGFNKRLQQQAKAAESAFNDQYKRLSNTLGQIESMQNVYNTEILPIKSVVSFLCQFVVVMLLTCVKLTQPARASMLKYVTMNFLIERVALAFFASYWKTFSMLPSSFNSDKAIFLIRAMFAVPALWLLYRTMTSDATPPTGGDDNAAYEKSLNNLSIASERILTTSSTSVQAMDRAETAAKNLIEQTEKIMNSPAFKKLNTVIEAPPASPLGGKIIEVATPFGGKVSPPKLTKDQVDVAFRETGNRMVNDGGIAPSWSSEFEDDDLDWTPEEGDDISGSVCDSDNDFECDSTEYFDEPDDACIEGDKKSMFTEVYHLRLMELVLAGAKKFIGGMTLRNTSDFDEYAPFDAYDVAYKPLPKAINTALDRALQGSTESSVRSPPRVTRRSTRRVTRGQAAAEAETNDVEMQEQPTNEDAMRSSTEAAAEVVACIDPVQTPSMSHKVGNYALRKRSRQQIDNMQTNQALGDETTAGFELGVALRGFRAGCPLEYQLTPTHSSTKQAPFDIQQIEQN